MKALKYIGITLLVIIVGALAALYFMPDHYIISNSIEINKPADVVYTEIADFKKWDAWDPYMEMEREAKVTYEGNAATVGQRMTWDGKVVGNGMMTLAATVPNQSINMDLDFIKPMKATAKDEWKIEAMGDETKVTWTSSGDLSYPMGRTFNFMLDKMVNKQEQHGLDNLKKVCEAMPAVAPVVVDSMATSNK